MSYALPTSAAEGVANRAVLLPTDRASAALGGRVALPVDLRALTAEAFGYSALRRFQLPAAGDPTSNGGYYPVAQGEAAALASTNMFGLPVFCQINLLGTHNPITLAAAEHLTLLDPIVTVEAPMTVVKTPITGRRGTVKEYIGQGDYGVVIRAILATSITEADRFAYPLPQVQKLRALCELGVALPVSGWLLDVYDIKSLVVENVRYESLPGFVNLQAYEIQCVSDEPIELAI